ncbi:hypothetical protein J6590_034273 [Homalodisca vitripennis]|nr:hypothetical protein J6590_034273 [Homalodisca vitripennis]
MENGSRAYLSQLFNAIATTCVIRSSAGMKCVLIAALGRYRRFHTRVERLLRHTCCFMCRLQGRI